MQIIGGLISLALMVFCLVVAWRVMKALELMANSISKIADKN